METGAQIGNIITLIFLNIISMDSIDKKDFRGVLVCWGGGAKDGEWKNIKASTLMEEESRKERKRPRL